jgi:hypothetical protein
MEVIPGFQKIKDFMDYPKEPDIQRASPAE